MNKTIKAMFEYQQFEENPKLQALIRETENRFVRALTDDDLRFVNAAGVPDEAAAAFEQDNEKRKDKREGCL